MIIAHKTQIHRVNIKEKLMGESKTEIRIRNGGEISSSTSFSSSTSTCTIAVDTICKTSLMLRSKRAKKLAVEETSCVKADKIEFKKTGNTPIEQLTNSAKNTENQKPTPPGGSAEDELSRKGKKRKWKKAPELLGFYLSPHLSNADEDTTQDTEEIDSLTDGWFGLEDFPNIKQNLIDICDKFEGKGGEKTLRATKKTKTRKAHNQVKDKYCMSIQNNNGKKLFIHHRVYKAISLQFRKHHYLSTNTNKAITFALENEQGSGKNTPSSNTGKHANQWEPVPKEAKKQNHRFALSATNIPTDIRSLGIVDILMSLQERELTPEDYELLLQLDERVAPKTISTAKLNRLKTDTATKADEDLVCAVCMDHYVAGQERKILPCTHIFHAACIDMWLSNSSQCCPLDGLSIS